MSHLIAVAAGHVLVGTGFRAVLGDMTGFVAVLAKLIGTVFAEMSSYHRQRGSPSKRG